MCKAMLSDGSKCPYKANTKYGQYCGKHAKIYYEDVMRTKLNKNIDDLKASISTTKDVEQVKKLNNKLAKTIKELSSFS